MVTLPLKGPYVKQIKAFCWRSVTHESETTQVFTIPNEILRRRQSSANLSNFLSNYVESAK